MQMFLVTDIKRFFSIFLLSLTATSAVIVGRSDREHYFSKNLGSDLVSLKEMTAAPHIPDYLKGQERSFGHLAISKRASESQCALALERIVLQPQSCSERLLANIARNIYSPFYQWFGNAASAAAQFSNDNGVFVGVRDAFMFDQVLVETSGIPQVYRVGNQRAFPMSFRYFRTRALNYPTFLVDTFAGRAYVVQNIWNFDGRMLTISISRDIDLLPITC